MSARPPALDFLFEKASLRHPASHCGVLVVLVALMIISVSAYAGPPASPGKVDAPQIAPSPKDLYKKEVTRAMEVKWKGTAGDRPILGRLKLHFDVDGKGKPQNLRILSDGQDAHPDLREITQRAILDADIPPIPKRLLPELEDGRLKIEYEVIVN